MHKKSGEKLNDKMHWLEHLAFAWHVHFCFPSTCTGFNSVPSLHCPVRRTSLPKGPTQHFRGSSQEYWTKPGNHSRPIIQRPITMASSCRFGKYFMGLCERGPHPHLRPHPTLHLTLLPASGPQGQVKTGPYSSSESKTGGCPSGRRMVLGSSIRSFRISMPSLSCCLMLATFIGFWTSVFSAAKWRR